MDGALDVVGHEADEEGEQDDDDHADGSGVAAPLASEGLGAHQEGTDDAGVADQDDQEGDDEADH